MQPRAIEIALHLVRLSPCEAHALHRPSTLHARCKCSAAQRIKVSARRSSATSMSAVHTRCLMSFSPGRFGSLHSASCPSRRLIELCACALFLTHPVTPRFTTHALAAHDVGYRPRHRLHSCAHLRSVFTCTSPAQELAQVHSTAGRRYTVPAAIPFGRKA